MCDCNKEKGELKGKGKRKKKCSENICNNQIFTLIITLEFKSGKTQKLKSLFKSKSSQGGCDLPNEKPFRRARKKLLDKWRKSQKSEGTTKTTDTLTNVNTQIVHNTNSNDSNTCTVCSFCNNTNLLDTCGISCKNTTATKCTCNKCIGY